MDEMTDRELARANSIKRMKEGFVAIPAKLLLDVAAGIISERAFVLYCFLRFRQGNKPTYWGSKKDMAWGTGISVGDLHRHLKTLENIGHIRRTRRSGETWITKCMSVVGPGGVVTVGEANVDSKPRRSPVVVKDEVAEAPMPLVTPEVGTTSIEAIQHKLDTLCPKPKSIKRCEFAVEFEGDSWLVLKRTDEDRREIVYSIVNSETLIKHECVTMIQATSPWRSLGSLEEEDPIEEDKRNVLRYLQTKWEQMEEAATVAEKNDEEDDGDLPLFG